MDLPCIQPLFKPYELEEGNNYNHDIVATSFLLDQNSCISSPFIVFHVRPDICLIHYVTNHIIFPRKENLSHLTIFNVVAVWLLANKLKQIGQVQ